MKKFLLLVVILGLGLSTAFAQNRTTQGSIGGTVLDPSGAAVPGAKVTVSGQTGVPKTLTTNAEGYFEVQNLDPGNYTVTVEQAGFKKTALQNVEVVVGRQNTVTANLEVGEATATVEVTDVAQIDQTSTAIGANLSDQLYENIPVQRSVTSLFYLSANVQDSLQGGRSNPTISGGSALDNLYIADGVNITDSSFGGLGVFSRVYGTIGVGITTSFIKEVQVKTGGFEPQFGQAQGGIINIITKSGGNEYHGSVFAYAQPEQFEAARRSRDTTSINKLGILEHQEFYDVGAEFSGYIPGARDNLFFYGSFNPSIRRDLVSGSQANPTDIERGLEDIVTSGLFRRFGTLAQRYRTWNYAFKMDYYVNQNHQINFSIFGDPTKTNFAPFSTATGEDETAFSTLDYGTRNVALKYNGTFSPTWNLSAVFSQGKNRFDELFDNRFNQILDRTNPVRGNFVRVGRGFVENTLGTTYRFTLDTTKQADFWGTHTFGVGYTYQDAFLEGNRERSGPRFIIPSENAFGESLLDLAGPDAAAAIGQSVDATFSLRTRTAAQCPLCPNMFIPGVGNRRVALQQTRGEFGNPNFDTESKYHAAYAQDTWRFNKYATALLGLRWEQEQILGTPDPINGQLKYTFTGQWSPRLGVTIDPRGQGKTKIYYNFGRFHEYIPLDLALRSLSSELDFLAGWYAPAFTVGAGGVRQVVLDERGNPIPIIDAAHLLSTLDPVGNGGLPFLPSVSHQEITNPILRGTKLGYADEHLVGFEQQLPRNWVLTVRFQDRRLKRIVEDAALVAPESISLFGQTYFIGNITSTLDAGVNPIPHVFGFGDPIPDACFDSEGNVPLLNDFVFGQDFVELGQICYEPFGAGGLEPGSSGADGVPDGFPDPVHIYRSLTVEMNKRFSDNWQLLSNVTFGSLRGNFEGHFRNDNGQTDPAISSLFDFTAGEFGLLGDQFAVGPLNTDRRVLANIFGSYTFDKEMWGGRLNGLTLGANLHGESGVPISALRAHPAYLNQGEIPVGGRGARGRTSPHYRLDLKADYELGLTENTRLRFTADFFNVFNNRNIRQVNEFVDSTFGQLNPDFLQPRNFYQPFNMRVGMKLEF